jgi:ABC-type polysaccharide/polyol phosphate transport system ATPase subunit
MSDPRKLAVQLRGVGKLYKLFERRRDHVLDAIGLGALLRWRGVAPRKFWALRGIDLDVPHGKRLGIVGRNGAGKSTLLKVITGALSPTEGTVRVDGRVQALFDAGSGFHPEFTGYENIDASLTYQGLDAAAIRAATEDIADFTELDEFLGQPLKTYSLGMQARLAFAVATVTRPDILIVDEVLGAGDAYFASKSTRRMRTLVEESGATVLLVSHDTSAVLRYCEDCVWVERGQIVQRGRALDVVNAYEGFIHDMEDQRLRARNERPARVPESLADGAADGGAAARAVRWRSEGSLTIERALFVDELGRERAVFKAGASFSMRMELEAHRAGQFNLVLGASIYRLDGVFVANLVSPPMPFALSAGERTDVWLEVPRLPIGDARYAVSLSLFEREVAEHTRYDLLAKAFEFQVTGSPPLTKGAVVQLDARWRVGTAAMTAGDAR